MIYSEILLPEYAPKEFADRSVLWNAVENFEKGSRAQLSREIEFSLPCELDADERLQAAKKLAEFFRDKGMVVDMNLHSPDHEKLCFCEGIGIGLVVIRDKNPAATTRLCINRVIKSQCENIMVYRAYRNA